MDENFRHSDANENTDDAMVALRLAFPAVTGIDIQVERLRKNLAQRGRAAVVPRPEIKNRRNLFFFALPLLSQAAAGLTVIARSGRSNAEPLMPRAIIVALEKGMPAATGMHGEMTTASLPSLMPVPTPVQDQSLATPSAPATSPAPVLLPVVERLLAPDWIDTLDLRAFDEIAFFRACGIDLDNQASLELRIDALHQCMQPMLSTTRSALNIDGLAPEPKILFFKRLQAALHLDGDADRDADQAMDPAFVQKLFDRWFLSLVAPPNAVDTERLYASAMHAHLLAVTHAAQVRPSYDGQRPLFSPLMRMDSLRAGLNRDLAKRYPLLSLSAGKWVCAALLSIVDPTLVRPDLPPHLRYGDLEWALLDIGIRLAGASHWDFGHGELVALALVADPLGATKHGALPQDGLQWSGGAEAVGAVLRMAHVAGVIDLRDSTFDVLRALPIAIGHFQMQLALQLKSEAIAAVGLPARRDTASRMLRELGADPDQLFTLSAARGYGLDLLGSQSKSLPCLTFDQRHALVDFFVSNCMMQLFQYGRLPSLLANNLHAKMALLSHGALNKRFEKEFDAAYETLADVVPARTLMSHVTSMAADDRPFWRYGNATVRIPEAAIVTRVPARADLGASGAGRPLTVSVKNYQADGALLVQLALTRRQQTEKRDYWVSLAPLAIMRFDGDVAELLRQKLHVFFKPGQASESLLRLHDKAPLRYRSFTDRGVSDRAAGTNTRFVARHLLASRLPQARAIAFQMTEPEWLRERLHQSLLDLLPLRACIQSISSAEAYRAVFFCGADLLSLLPIAGAASKVAGSAARMSATLSVSQGKALAWRYMSGSVGPDVAAPMIAATLRLGKPLIGVGKCALQWLNPVQDAVFLGAWVKQGGQLLRQRLQLLQQTAGLRRLADKIERGILQQRVVVAELGFWRAAPGAAVVVDGHRQLKFEGQTYLLTAIGDHKDVVTLQQGTALRLANPASGLAYGPVLNRPLAAADVSNPPQPFLRKSCGSVALLQRKRRGDDEQLRAACGAIMRVGHFGRSAFSFRQRVKFHAVQIGAGGKQGREMQFNKIDLNEIGFSSYSIQQRAGVPMMVYNERYFAFNDEVWLVENSQLIII